MTFNQLLSIGIPAYNRPQWFERALNSITATPLSAQQQVEIIVSDDSTTSDCKTVFETYMADWNGLSHYQANTPSLGMAANWNNCIRLASGRYILILHDDDYLEPGAVCQILAAIQQYSEFGVLLFSVNIVTAKEQIKKRQRFRQQQYLEPKAALKQVLSNSSFVRFPGIVLRQDVFTRKGYFDESVGSIADIHLWARAFNRFGVLCLPKTIANYTVHSQALTMKMFDTSVLNELSALFDWIKAQEWLEAEELAYCEANFFHQFILAGTVRHMRIGKFRQAHQTLQLFQELELDNSKVIAKWRLINFFLQILLAPRTYRSQS